MAGLNKTKYYTTVERTRLNPNTQKLEKYTNRKLRTLPYLRNSLRYGAQTLKNDLKKDLKKSYRYYGDGLRQMFGKNAVRKRLDNPNNAYGTTRSGQILRKRNQLVNTVRRSPNYIKQAGRYTGQKMTAAGKYARNTATKAGKYTRNTATKAGKYTRNTATKAGQRVMAARQYASNTYTKKMRNYHCGECQRLNAYIRKMQNNKYSASQNYQNAIAKLRKAKNRKLQRNLAGSQYSDRKIQVLNKGRPLERFPRMYTKRPNIYQNALGKDASKQTPFNAY